MFHNDVNARHSVLDQLMRLIYDFYQNHSVWVFYPRIVPFMRQINTSRFNYVAASSSNQATAPELVEVANSQTTDSQDGEVPTDSTSYQNQSAQEKKSRPSKAELKVWAMRRLREDPACKKTATPFYWGKSLAKPRAKCGEITHKYNDCPTWAIP